eukprot:scaffold258884_cov17-Prasinocladus_malaysianus.AAC.1
MDCASIEISENCLWLWILDTTQQVIGREELSRTVRGLRHNCLPLSIRRLPGVMELPWGALFACQGYFARRADKGFA